MHLVSLNSVDHIMHLLLQAFEGVVYLHRHDIAHRTASVYHRFETDIRFSDDEKERVTNTFPIPDRSWYQHPLAPELVIPDTLATDILRFKVFQNMCVEDPDKRPDIHETLDALVRLDGNEMLDNDDDRRRSTIELELVRNHIKKYDTYTTHIPTVINNAVDEYSQVSAADGHNNPQRSGYQPFNALPYPRNANMDPRCLRRIAIFPPRRFRKRTWPGGPAGYVWVTFCPYMFSHMRSGKTRSTTLGP
ncbi:hypothetical protein F5146DRAFT_1152235 [Armillaria mellea]|nr:hypothetical protein F5146DRAFT_1152235 [Armillaria mellea]